MKKETFAQVSLILGIVALSLSVIECIIPLIILAYVVGVVGIVFGIIGVNSDKKQTSISGIILSVSGILAASVWLYLALIA